MQHDAARRQRCARLIALVLRHKRRNDLHSISSLFDRFVERDDQVLALAHCAHAKIRRRGGHIARCFRHLKRHGRGALRDAAREIHTDVDLVCRNDGFKQLECAVSTGPFPEFPTDMQSQFLALMAVSGNFCIMEENVFDTRFKAAYELNRLGADIRIEGRTAYVYGRRHLHGGTVTASDLRGGAALVLAGLFADEPVTVRDCEYIRRGYENLSGDLRELGARIYECSID